MASDEIKERQKIQRFNLTNGGAVEVNGSECGNVFVETFDEDSADHGMVLEPTPAECDALIAAIGRALGRPASTSTPLEERIAASLRGAQQAKPFATDQGRAQAIVEVWERALAMVREQGATVPRAGVAAALAPVFTLHAQVAEECSEERNNAIEALLTALDEARATLAAAGLWPVPADGGAPCAD